MLDRRRHDRSRDFAAGTIAYGRGRATLDCVVRNVSEGGALLVLDDPRRAPVEMDLSVAGGVRAARTVWRGEAVIGVAFLAAGSQPDRPSPSTVVDLAAVRRARLPGGDDRRLAERIARFVRPARRPDRD